jgi:hypothetical protein
MKPMTIAVALLCAALAAWAQEKASEPKSQEKAPELKPQKEHDALRVFEGRWDVKCKWTMPGKEPQENMGTEAARLSFNGFWLVSDFRAEFDKKPFHGHSMTGWDPQTKKYVAVWFASKSPEMIKFEGDADESGKKWTLKGECFDPATGKTVPHRLVWEITDKDHRTERVYIVGEDGKETLVGDFTYTRRPGKAESK